MNTRKYIIAFQIIVFFFLGLCPFYVRADQDFSINALPVPGQMVSPSASFKPTLLNGIHIYPDNPLMFDFIIDADGQGDDGSLKQEGQKLIKYFLAALTIPSKDQWVNLSPYEKNRIAPAFFDQTAMGRDMLSQDYVLKQLTASLIYPEKSLGKEFWRRVYKQAQEKFGTTKIPVNTFNKVWIVADKVHLFSRNNTVYIIDSHLKVMLDEDYVALQKHVAVPNGTGSVGANIIREIVIPEVEKEVNTGRNFALLRQVYHSVILAAWYKKNLTQALLNQIYSDQDKIPGISLSDPSYKEQVFERYMRAYRKGAFNLIKEEVDPLSNQMLPRKYFSGGVHIVPEDFAMVGDSPAVRKTIGNSSNRYLFSVSLEEMDAARNKPKDAAMSIEERLSRWVPKLNITANPSEDPNHYFTQVNKVAAFLKSKEMERRVGKKLGIKSIQGSVFIVEENTNTFQVGWYKGDLYIERGFLNYVEELHKNGQDVFDLFSFAVVHALVENEYESYHAQYEYARTLKSARTEFLKLEQSFDFDGIFERGKSALVNNTPPEELQKRLGIPIRRHNGVIHKNTEMGTDQLTAALEESVYRIPVNHMNGKSNLYNKARAYADDPTSVKGKKLKVGTLAYASNPPTDAHTVLTALKSMAESETDDFLILVTKGDPRKPALQETFDERYEMSKIVFEYIFGKREGDHIPLIRVMPQLPDDKGLNGEEKIIPLVELNKDADSIEISYTAGGDHFLSVALKEGNKVYVNVTRQNMNDFLYYARLPGYKELLERIRDFDDGSHRADLDELITAAEAGGLEDLIKSQPVSEHKIHLPLLDTVSKLYLDNMYFMYLKKNGINGFKDKDVKIRMISVVRGPAQRDQLRDQMIDRREIEVVENVGLDIDISSTNIRKGVVKFFRTGVIDYDEFAFVPVPILEYIFKPENREYLYFLARLQEANLPQALTLMDPLTSAEREQGIRVEANQGLRELVPPYEISESVISSDRKTTTVSIINTQSRRPAVSMEYNVLENLNSNGKPQVKINLYDTIHQGVSGDLADNLEDALGRYIYKVNGADVSVWEAYRDKAMSHQGHHVFAQSIESSSYGGIDFDPSNLDMEESGQEIEMHLDRAQIEQFKRRGIAGFNPRTIKIEQVSDISSLFGLSGSFSQN